MSDPYVILALFSVTFAIAMVYVSGSKVRTKKAIKEDKGSTLINYSRREAARR